eukprot:scaffold90574_cov33-Tisochrysis_lutea.AAC.1
METSRKPITVSLAPVVSGVHILFLRLVMQLLTLYITYLCNLSVVEHIPWAWEVGHQCEMMHLYRKNDAYA